MLKKILVTGGAGFIGLRLADNLSQNKDNNVIIVDNFQRGRKDHSLNEVLKKSNVTLIEADLTNAGDLAKFPNDVDHVYHLAAIVGVKHCLQHPEKVLRTNLLSTINIIDYVRSNRIKKILFSSTCENYAGGFEHGIIPIPTPENIPLVVSNIENPRWSYAGSKIAGEQMIIFNAPGNYNYSIVRYHNIFGPRMGYAHVIPEVVKRIHQNETPFKLYGKNQTRAFCFIEDAVTQTILAMEHSSLNNQIVHIGNDSEEIKIGDLVHKIFKITGKNPPTVDEKEHNASVNRRCPNTSKIRSSTEFKPAYKLDEALQITVEWYHKEIELGRVWE